MSQSVAEDGPLMVAYPAHGSVKIALYLRRNRHDCGHSRSPARVTRRPTTPRHRAARSRPLSRLLQTLFRCVTGISLARSSTTVRAVRFFSTTRFIGCRWDHIDPVGPSRWIRDVRGAVHASWATQRLSQHDNSALCTAGVTDESNRARFNVRKAHVQTSTLTTLCASSSARR